VRHLVLLAASCVLAVGCGPGPEGPGDAAPVFSAVLELELEGTEGEAAYLFVDGKDPPPELLGRLREQWPELQPGSKAPEGKARRVSVGGLRWIGGDAAEVRGGWSDGTDGAGHLYRVVRRGGAWVVRSRTTEAVS
jgi:hypothetical protein